MQRRHSFVTGLLSAFLSMAGATGAAGQAITGVVTEEETGNPIRGALVTLIDAAGRERLTLLTDTAGRFLFRLPLLGAAQQQRHGHIFQGRKLRQQVMKLPDEANLAIAELSRGLAGKRSQPQVAAVYVTLGSGIKRSQDVQQGTLAGSGLAYNGKHFTLFHAE